MRPVGPFDRGTRDPRSVLTAQRCLYRSVRQAPRRRPRLDPAIDRGVEHMVPVRSDRQRPRRRRDQPNVAASDTPWPTWTRIGGPVRSAVLRPIANRLRGQRIPRAGFRPAQRPAPGLARRFLPSRPRDRRTRPQQRRHPCHSGTDTWSSQQRSVRGHRAKARTIAAAPSGSPASAPNLNGRRRPPVRPSTPGAVPECEVAASRRLRGTYGPWTSRSTPSDSYCSWP